MNESNVTLLNLSDEEFNNLTACHSFSFENPKTECTIYFLKDADFASYKQFQDAQNVADFVIDARNLSCEKDYLSLASVIETAIADFARHDMSTSTVYLKTSLLYPTHAIRDFSDDRLAEYVTEDAKISSGVLSNECVQAAVNDSCTFTMDGHHRLVAAIINDHEYIHADISDVPEHTISIMNKSDYYDYEDMCGGKFYFSKYPEEKEIDNLYISSF